MQSRKQKFVVKCRMFAVLVDLHILPQGVQNGSTWFSQEHKEEVGALIKDAIEQRVRLFQTKHRKELSSDNPLLIKGQTLRLAAYFMKRHVNLRCVIRQHYRELHIFPERFVVCVSLTEFDMTHFANLNVNVFVFFKTEQCGQSRSGYFSGPREPLDLLNSSMIAKMVALQKIHPNACPRPGHEIQDENQGAILSQLPNEAVQDALQEKKLFKDEVTDVFMKKASVESRDCAEQHDMDRDSKSIQQDLQTGRRRRRILSHWEDFDHQEVKRPCIREPFVGAGTHSTSVMALTQSSTLGPSPRHPGAAAQASSESMLEEELLTHGKLHLPLSNSTAKHTNQSRLATSLRDLSVKAVSSGSSISSRSAAKEEEKPNVPRISRLRRLKKS